MASIRPTAPIAALTGLLALAGEAHAAGFAIIEQSVSGLGNAFAGGAAAAEDATTVYFNPAGMARLEGAHVLGAGHLISPSIEFKDANSTDALGNPLTGGDGGDAGSTAFVPNFYYVRPISQRVTFGLGVNAPFGLETEYDPDWKGRYQAIKSAIRSANINPSLAFKIDEHWSAGAGVSLQYIDAELTSAVDYAVACLGLPGGLPATCAADGLGAANVQSDAASGLAENTADDWSWGYNLGLLYAPRPGTRLGLAYRSKIEHTLEGDGDFTVASNVQSGAGLGAATLRAVFADSDIVADITLPETLSVSIYHELDRSWAIMGDVTRTRWSRIPELRIEYANPSKADSVEALGWEDSNRYSVGLSYFYSDALTLRGGLAVDETPIPDTQRRTARLPGNDRRWLAVGLSYRVSDRFSFDAAYAHLFVSDVGINRTGALNDPLKGTYENSVDILSTQARWNF